MKSGAGRETALAVARRLSDAGHAVFFAGGCVRDGLLGREVQDYDVATSATPEALRAIFPDAVAAGAHFGVFIVDGVEVATFRSEHSYRDGRRPEHVEFETDPRRDVQRRDFTINGLLEDPLSGEVYDYVGGRADLEAGIIRAIGDPAERFAEDHLRMLRAVRFAARLGFSIEAETLAAIRRESAQIQRISAERVRDELARILTEGGARRGFEWLDKTGLLEAILPEVARMKGVAQPPEFHPEGDVWAHTLLLLENLQQPSLALALGALLHDVGKPPTFRIAERIRFDGHVEAGVALAEPLLRRLRFPKEVTEQALALIANHMKWRHIEEMRESTLKRFLRMDGFDEHLELHRLDCLASHGSLAHYEFAAAKREELPEEVIRPPRLVTGDDLLAMGLAPGPRFRALLSQIEDAQLENRIVTREEALRYAAELADEG